MKKPQKVIDAETLLANSGKAGFRKANKKDIAKAKEIIKEDRNKRAKDFLAEYKEVCKKHGIEVKAQMEQVEGMPAVRAGLYLDEYVERVAPEMKPWSEAMAENLDARSICEHKLHSEGGRCEKCGLEKFKEIDGEAVPAWGDKGKGVTSEYRKEILRLIEVQKKEEAEKEAAETAEGEDK